MLVFGLNPLELLLLTGTAGLAFGLTRLRRYRQSTPPANRIIMAAADGLLLTSILVIVLVTLTPLAGPYRIAYSPPNLVPVVDMLNTLSQSRSSALRILGGNILLFVPLGFAQAFRRRGDSRDIIHVTLMGAILSAVVESLQLIIPLRGSNVDDLILNTVGTWLGALAGWRLRQRITARFPYQRGKEAGSR